MDNTPDWDSLSDTPPLAPPVPQDRSTPIDSQVADFADEANRRVAAGEDPAAVEADLHRKVESTQTPRVTAGSKKASTLDWDSLSDTPPRPDELTSAYQPLPSFYGQQPESPLAPRTQPEAQDYIGEQPPDFGTGGGQLDTSALAPALASEGRAIASGIPRSLASGEASLVKFAANIAPALVAGTGNPVGGAALEAELSPYAEQATQVEQQVAQERAEAKASGASTPISRAVEAGIGAGYALPQYAVVPEFEGAQLAVAAVRALPASYSAAKTTFADLLPKVGVAKALEASGLAGIVNLAGASLPLGAAGNMTERAAAGAIVGGASEEAQRAGQNVILSDHPELQQPFDPESLVQAAGTMAGLGAAGGGRHVDEAQAAAERVQQLTRGLTNAREIPQDQGVLPEQGIDQEGGGETGGEGVQRGEAAGNAPGDEGQQVAAETANERPPATPPETPSDASAARTTDAVAAREEGLPAPFYARAETAGVDDAREAADAAKAWREQGTDSPYFQRYFEGSKVVDADGEPLVVHHGTGEDFAAFEGDKAGETTGHMTAPLGHFFAVDRGSAERYAEKAAQGVPADERVIDAYLSIKNPKTMSLDQFMAIDSQDEARALRASLQQQGYDGIHLTDAGKGQWIAFDPTQIKDVGNRGTFDTGDARMKYAAREGAPQTDNLTRDEARQALAKEFGATALRKLEANGLNLVSRGEIGGQTSELSPQQRARVKGFTPPDRSAANIVHDNVTRQELPETVIHEVAHANLDRILPEATRNALASAIQARARQSPEVKAALDAIPKTTPKGGYREEVLAQTMGNLYTQPIGRRVMDAFKLGLNRMGVPLDWLNAHEAAIRQIGIENLRHYAEAPRRAPVTTFQMTPQPVATPQEGAAEEQAAAPAPKPRVRMTPEQLAERMAASQPKTENRVPENRIRPQEPGNVVGEPPPAAEATRAPSPEAVGGKPAARPAESAPGAVGISRRVVDPEQIAAGNEPLQAQGKRDFGAAWDAATQKRAENPDAGRNLVADLLTDPRPLRAEDTALLTQYKAEISNRYDAAVKAQNDARAAGDRRGEIAAGVQRKMIEEERRLFDQAGVNSGYESSLSLSIRRMLSDRDYSMVGQTAAFKAIEGGEIPDAVRKQLEKYVNQHQAANDAFMKAAAADEVKTATPARTPRQRKSLDDDFSRMAGDLRRLSEKPEMKTAAAYARVEDPAMADLIRKMARNRSDAGETDPAKILDTIHSAIGGSIPRVDIADTVTARGTGRRHTLSEFQARYNALLRELKGNPKDRARQTALRNELAKIKSAIQRKDYEPEKAVRTKPQYSEPTRALEREVEEARRRIDGLRAQRERANMGIIGKSVDLITNIQMMDILLGLPVFKKLAGSVIATHISTPLTEMGVSIAKALNPSLRKYAAEAPRWGAGFRPGSVKATYGFDPRFQSANGSALKASMSRLLKGVTESQKQYGEAAMTHEYTDFMGNLADAWATKNGWEIARTISGIPGSRSHGAVKEFSSTPEERRGLYYRTLHMREKLAAQGWTPEQIDAFASKRDTQAMLGAGSHADGLRSKYQEDNKFNDWVNRQIGASYRYGIAGHIARGAFKLEAPVRQIAMNIVSRIASYSFGGVGAYAKARQFKGMSPEKFAKSITPEVADYIMRNNGRQMVGIPMLTLAFLGGAKIFGGLWSKDKKDEEVQPGEVNLAGTHLAAQWSHDPFAQLLHIGTSLRETFDSYYSKEQPGYYQKLESFAKALAGTYADVAKEDIPYISAPLRDIDTYEKAEKFRHRGGSELIGSKIRSIVIPQELQRQAKQQTGGYPQPRSIPEDVAIGIPDYGLGLPIKSVKQVPQKGNRKYRPD